MTQSVGATISTVVGHESHLFYQDGGRHNSSRTRRLKTLMFSQVSYLGFCGTLGADYVQYMIADETLIPEENRRFYTEKVIYMPHSYFVNDHKQVTT